MNNIKKHGQYRPCRECGFWVRVGETYCPNCGIITPLWKIPTVRWPIPKQSMLVGGCLYFLIKGAFMFWQRTEGSLFGNLWDLVYGSLVAGLFFGAAVSTIKFLWDKVKQQRYTQTLQRWSTSSLKTSANAIAQRLEEMRIRERRILETLQDIGEAPVTEQAQKSIETLKSSLAALQIQRDRYIAKSWEITLIRWYNALKPLTEDMKALTYEKCANRINRVTEVIRSGTAMLESWKAKANLTRPQHQCIIRLRKALNTCEKVQHDLLAYKAALAVQDVSPLAEHVQSEPAVVTSLEQLDVFSILPDIGEFTAGIKALDAEYFRLKGEEEIYQEFEAEE